uniref:Transcobalamin-like C-terminal domain-containing protein n=1 Tax=Oryzias latipes TaxID=8090 RepID=A0A3P9HVA1_ORYLA
MKVPALIAAALLLLLPAALTQNFDPAPIQIVVKNSFLEEEPLAFNSHVAHRGILLGAMRTLMDSDTNFKFTYREDPNYGPYLESINGLAGKDADQTYWELLVMKPDGAITRPDVGIGCYIPSANEKIIFNFTKWTKSETMP